MTPIKNDPQFDAFFSVEVPKPQRVHLTTTCIQLSSAQFVTLLLIGSIAGAVFFMLPGGTSHAATRSITTACIAHAYSPRSPWAGMYYVRSFGATTRYTSVPSGCTLAGSSVVKPTTIPTATTKPVTHTTTAKHAIKNIRRKAGTSTVSAVNHKVRCVFQINSNGKHFRSCNGATIEIIIDEH